MHLHFLDDHPVGQIVEDDKGCVQQEDPGEDSNTPVSAVGAGSKFRGSFTG
jgi:hypothetical protein